MKVDEHAPESDGHLHPGAARPVVLILQGPQQGALFPLGREPMVIGRGEEADVRLTDDGISIEHARVSWSGRQLVVEDLGSRLGTFLEGRRIIERTPIEEGDYLRLGNSTWLKLAWMRPLEERALTELFESTLRDPLTRLYNRRYFDERVRSEFSFAVRHRTCMALLIADIDHFKRVNDGFGHQAGDVVLREVARTLVAALRPEDVVARYGGEEFVVIARGLNPPGAVALGERMRECVAHLRTPVGQAELSVTISVGVAQACPDDRKAAVDELIASADRALYGAKEAGRNRVCLAPDEPFA